MIDDRGCAKIAERIGILLGVPTPGDARNALDGVLIADGRGFDVAFTKLLCSLVCCTVKDNVYGSVLPKFKGRPVIISELSCVC